jgi:hypothetical protein
MPQPKSQPDPIFEPTYTVDTFCRAENMSRTRLYEAWAQGWGPEFYRNGNQRRITHAARLRWQAEREAAARTQERNTAEGK